MKMPMASIIIPVYNGANFLEQAIRSALCQTYGHKEIIVINDGSDDGGHTARIARSFENRIHYYEKENGGVASALNMGLQKMNGTLFSWLSHDDLFSPNRIETDVTLFQADPRTRITFCKLEVIDKNGQTIKACPYPLRSVSNPREALLLGGVDMGTMTIHKSCFDRVGLFDENNLTTQDVIMALSLSKYFSFVYNGNAVKYTREHPERGTNTMRQQVKKDSLFICDFLYEQCAFEDLFPDIDTMKASEIASGWQWLGKLYRYFGNETYSEECFTKMREYLAS